MAVDDVYRMTIMATFQSHQLMNTFAVRMKSSPDPVESDIVTMANALKEAFRPQQHGTITYTSWSFSQLYGGGVTVVQDQCRRTPGLQMAGLFGGSLSGGLASGDALPPQCSLVWTLLTGYAGRRRRGRSYVFGLPEGAQTNGLWTTTVNTTSKAALATILGLYGVSGTDPQFQLGVWSERTASGCVPNPSGKGLVNLETPRPELAFMRMTGYTVRDVVYTQRRRTLGVGR
jgi:hypothetical protein